jgi:hypothetical protein
MWITITILSVVPDGKIVVVKLTPAKNCKDFYMISEN